MHIYFYKSTYLDVFMLKVKMAAVYLMWKVKLFEICQKSGHWLAIDVVKATIMDIVEICSIMCRRYAICVGI